MQNWKKFEKDALDYLNENYSDYASFLSTGGEDSTKSDILVKTKKENFYIEIKSPNAQSGQFVVLPDYKNHQFYFSDKNKTDQNNLTKKFLEHMNSSWDIYKNISSKGVEINLSNEIFSEWIINYYKSKEVKYFISSWDNKFVIIPIDKFAESFKVTAQYRIKKSGTRKLPKNLAYRVTNYLKQTYEDAQVNKIGDHTYLETKNNSLNKSFFQVDGLNDQKFYLSKDDLYPQGYRISVRSKTNNPNVIFTIELISNSHVIDGDKFKELIR